jgi:hypothetical protein
MFKLLCKFGFHAWHYSQTNRVRMCGNCHRFENQINMPDDPIRNYQLMEEQEIAPSGFEGIA